MGKGIAGFLRQRAEEVARLGREAEAAAHEAYRMAIRKGEDLKLSSPGEVMRQGGKLLREQADRAMAAASTAVEQTKRQADEVLRRVGQNPTSRSAAIAAARGAGNVAGVVRGGVHAAEGVVDGARFIGRLSDPYDKQKSPPGQSAVEQLGRGVATMGQSAADYALKGLTDPHAVFEDVRDKALEWRRDLDPSAAPAAPTFEGELRRNFDIGQNQGELAFDVASLWYGGPAAKAVKGLGRVSNVGKVERYVAQGFSPQAAKRLAEPYPSRGMGHHFVPRSKELPKSYSDGVFNVLKPEGISRGDFYELHYKVDPSFEGARLIPGESWRGRQLGLEKYGLAGRIWHGSPPPLKARVGGLGASAGTGIYLYEDAGEGR